MDGLLRDVRHGFRMLLRTPLLSTVAVLTVGLGVGATTFAYSVVAGTLLAGPPMPVADRLVLLSETRLEEGETQLGVPWADYLDFLEAQTSFEHLEGQRSGTVNLAGEDGPPERFQGSFVTPGFLSMTGIRPVLGAPSSRGTASPEPLPPSCWGGTSGRAASPGTGGCWAGPSG